MILFGILVVCAFLAVVVQEFIPPVAWMHGARVFILPVLVFYSALALPYPGFLALTFLSGFMVDALNTQVLNPLVDPQVEVSLGWSILLYAVLGTIMSGFRPLFHRGRWEIHCLFSGLFTSIIVLAEYLMITIRRGGFVFTADVWWRVGGAGIIAAMLGPIFYFGLNWIASLTGQDIKPEQKGLN